MRMSGSKRMVLEKPKFTNQSTAIWTIKRVHKEKSDKEDYRSVVQVDNNRPGKIQEPVKIWATDSRWAKT